MSTLSKIESAIRNKIAALAARNPDFVQDCPSNHAEVAQKWVDAGFSAEVAESWIKCSAFYPSTAQDFIAIGWVPSDTWGDQAYRMEQGISSIDDIIFEGKLCERAYVANRG